MQQQPLQQPPQEPRQNQDNPPADPPQGRPKKEKPKKESWALKPEHLQTRKGLQALYEKTQTLRLDESATVNVEATMKKIMVALKTWHFEMAPRYTFDYFLQRLQALGTHPRVAAYLAKVRKIHKGIDVWPEEPDQNEAKQENQPLGVRQDTKHREERGLSIDQEMREELNLLDGRKPQEDEEEDEDKQLLDMMHKLQNTGAKKEVKPPQSPEKQYEDYLPEGHDFDFSEQNM